jgi:tetratricopeptide (TPR) repeat protein
MLRSVLSFYDRFAQQNTKNPKLQGEAAWAYRRVGDLYHHLGREEEAEEAYASAIRMLEELARQFPGDPEFRSKLVKTYLMADPWLAAPSSLGRAEHRLRRALTLIEKLAAEAPEDVEYAQARVQLETKLGAASQRLGRPDEAEGCYREALALAGALIERSPDAVRVRLDRVAAREALALHLFAVGRHEEALTQLDANADELRSLATRGEMPGPVGDHVTRLAEIYGMLGETDRAGAMARWAGASDSRPPHDRPDPGERPRPRPRAPHDRP